MLKKILKKMFYILSISVMLGTVCMVAVYMLPVAPMRKNVERSLDVLMEDGDYPTWLDGHHTYTVTDGFTDVVMLAEAVHEGSGNPIKDAMLNIRPRAQERFQAMTLERMLHDNNRGVEEIVYARYWHGYLVILKPLLLLFSVSDIRIINQFAQFLLLVFLMYKMSRRYSLRYVLSFGITIGPHKWKVTHLSSRKT